MSIEIVELPRPDDDMIVRVTGLPLIDADPAVIARRLKDESWTERAQFFSSIYSDSFNHLMEMVDYTETDDDRKTVIEWAMLKMHERIGQTLDAWGEDKPAEDMAVLLFALSLNPHHRQAASEFFKDRAAPHPSQQFNEIASELMGLRVFYNSSELIRPGLSHVWRQGVPEDHGVLFYSP